MEGISNEESHTVWLMPDGSANDRSGTFSSYFAAFNARLMAAMTLRWTDSGLPGIRAPAAAGGPRRQIARQFRSRSPCRSWTGG